MYTQASLPVSVVVFLIFYIQGVHSELYKANYLGCYVDKDSSKRLLSHQENIDNNSPKACIELCKSKSYAFAGMQYGVECFCGNERPSFKARADESDCSTRCPGEAGAMCGAGWRTSIYKTGLDGSSGDDDLSYTGCFADYGPNFDRLYDKHQMDFPEGMTPHYCVGLCYGLGYLYAALQYNFQCFCGNRHPPSTLIRANDECELDCPGDTSKKCGGHWKNSVYSTTITDIPVLGRYAGCYVDGEPENRLLKGLQRNFKKTNTPQLCVNFCHSNNFRYAAIQYGQECFCGNEGLPSVGVADKECNLECPGDHSRACGGNWRSSLYQIDKSQSYRSPQYLGCFKDKEGFVERLFGYKQEFHSSLTIEKCIEICRSKGFHYAAIQFKYECFCDDRKPSTDLLVNESDCHYPCTGDGSQICGGDWRLSVYATGQRNPYRHMENYFGCFKEKNAPNRILPYDLVTFDKTMTPELCIQYCFRKGYCYAGVESGNQCFCGDNRPLPDRKTDDSHCSTKCSGDKRRKCGGDWKLSIFKTGLPRYSKSHAERNYIGCFNSNKKILRDYKIDLENNTPQRCMSICKTIGYTYAGTEYGIECYCGFKAPSNDASVADNECSTICAGNNSQNCGGALRMSLYSTSSVGHGGGDDVDDKTVIDKPVRTCQKSRTEVNGQQVCEGVIIFNEPFNSLSKDTWQNTIKISEFPDHNFVYYSADRKNSFVTDGILHIHPTFVPDQEVPTGKLQLVGCTGEVGSTECLLEATSFRILPPVASAEIFTKNTFSFQYGVVEIKAKLPAGDWIIPEIWLEPKHEVYGPNLLSGRIKIAMALGNENLVTKDAKDISCKHLDSGVIVGHDGFKTGRYVSNSSPKCWSNDFHNYTLVWTPDDIQLIVDGEPLQTIMAGSDARLCSLLGQDKLCSGVWANGTKITPFDKEFYVKLGVTVGGMHEFPDDCTSNGHNKPWKNNELKAMLKFWQDKARWSSTWKTEAIDLQVDYVKVRAL